MKNSKITFILPSLEFGGVEVMKYTMAKELKRRGYEVEFVILRSVGRLLPKVQAEFSVIELKVPRILRAILPMIKYFRSHKIRTVFVSMWPLTTITVWARFLSGTQRRIIISDHGVLSQSKQAQGLWAKFKMKLTMRMSYPFADEIVSVSKGVADDISKLSGVPISKIRTIGNPAARGNVPDAVSENPIIAKWLNAKYKIVTAGRLKPVKDLPTLFRSIAILKNTLDIHLLVLGDGELRTEWTEYVKHLRIEDCVTFGGFVPDPRPYYLHANIFALTSLHEGFGNVIVEAMECGIPVVSTDCDFGPREILEYGRWGRLVSVGDSEQLAKAMQAEIESPLVTSEDLKLRAKDFSVERATDFYLELLDP